MTPNKFTLNALRGIMAILIVVHHYEPLNSLAYFDFGGPIVLFFFMLSGFLTYYNWHDRIGEDGSGKAFFHKRLSKLYYLQWISLLLLSIVYLWLGRMPESNWTIPCQFLLIQSFIPFWEIHFSFNTPTWFLSSLLFCYLMTPLLLRFIQRRGMKIFMIGLTMAFMSFYGALHLLPESIGTRWLIYINPGLRLMEYAVGFVMGYVWIKYNDFFKNLPSGLLMTLIETGLAVALFVMFSTRISVSPWISHNFPHLLEIIALSLMILTFSAGKGAVSRLMKNKVLLFLGDLSMMIYVIHISVLSIVGHLAGPYMPAWLSFALVLTILLIICYALNRYVNPAGMKFTSKIFNTILNLGNRKKLSLT